MARGRLTIKANSINKTQSHAAPWLPSVALSTLGFTVGTALDAIHSNVSLQTYGPYAVTLANGLVKTSLVVPPLLSLFYVSIGLLYLASDNLLNEAPKRHHQSQPQLLMVLQGFLILSLELQLSASLFSNDAPFPLISTILASAFLFNWIIFDRTKQGLCISLACGVVAPIAELVLMRAVQLATSQSDLLPPPLWYYARADIFPIEGLDGIVSWVPWCYAFYSPVLGCLGRYLGSRLREDKDSN